MERLAQNHNSYTQLVWTSAKGRGNPSVVISQIMMHELTNAELNTFANALPYGVLVAKPDGTVVGANRRWTLPCDTYLIGRAKLLDHHVLGDLLKQNGYALAIVAAQIRELTAAKTAQISLPFRDPQTDTDALLRITCIPFNEDHYLVVQHQPLIPDSAELAEATAHKHLLKLSRTITNTLVLDDMLRWAHHALYPLIDYDAFALFLLDPDTNHLRMVSRIEPSAAFIYPDDWSVPLGTGVAALIYESDAGLIINHAERHPASRYPEGTHLSHHHLLGIPLYNQAEKVGILLLERYAEQPFTHEQHTLFIWFAQHISQAIANATLFAGVQRRVQHLDLLRRAHLELANVLDLEHACQRAVEVAHTILNYPRVGLHLVQDQRMVLKHQIGYKVINPEMPLDRGVIGRARLRRAPEFVRNVQHDPDFIGSDDTGSELALPLFEGDDVIGVLNIETAQHTMLTDEDLSLLVLFSNYVSQTIARARLHTTIREREQRFQALIEHADEMIFILDQDGLIQYTSPAVQRVLGYAPEELFNTPLLGYLQHEDSPDLPIADTISNLKSGAYQMRHAQQGSIDVEVHVSNLLDNPAVRGIVINCHDVTSLKQAARQMRHQALYDPLTGLPNRAYLMQALDLLFDRANSTKNNHSITALLFIDLDDFKLINDTLGHLIGDEFLKQIAHRLRDELPPHATIARLGGDEFTVILSDLHSPQQAIEMAELVQSSFDHPLHVGGFELRARASIGVALHTHTFTNPHDLLRAADTAMYRAKNSGKNQVAIFDTSMYSEVAGQLRMQLDLPHAIAHNEFELEYHPIVDLKTGYVQGMRAELFWNHPRLGRMPYVVFNDAAKAIRFESVIAHWSVSEALQHLRAWCDATGTANAPHLHLAFPHAYLRDPQMCRSLAALAATVGVPLSHITAVIDSKVILQPNPQTLASLHCLITHNVSISVGGAGLQEALVNLPEGLEPTCIRLPHSVTASLEDNQRSVVIAQSIISMAHQMGIQVQAPDVQTTAQVGLLKTLACDYASGSFFSRPLPGLAVAAILRRGMHTLAVGADEQVLFQIND